jgi:excisionase family DNA binding protein
MDPEELLTPDEVAKLLRCNRRTVIRFTHLPANPLKVEKLSPRLYRFRREDVETFRNQSRTTIPV